MGSRPLSIGRATGEARLVEPMQLWRDGCNRHISCASGTLHVHLARKKPNKACYLHMKCYKCTQGVPIAHGL